MFKTINQLTTVSMLKWIVIQVHSFMQKRKNILKKRKKNSMLEKKVNATNRALETTRDLKRWSISEKKENKIEINNTKIKTQFISYWLMKKGECSFLKL